MNRLRSAFLLGGAVLLTSYISAPAAPTPAPARASAPELDAIDASAPLIAAATQETALINDATQEAARLRARLVVVPEKPVIQRDPFSFGTRPRSPRPATVVPEPQPETPEVEPPPLVWPKLVALLTDNGKITAVIGVGDAVEMLKSGESAGGFLVRDITSTSIEVVHVATSAATRLTLR